MKKASHCRHSCLIFYWAMFVSWYSQVRVFYFQIAFPGCCYKVFCVDTDTVKQIWSLKWLKQLSNRDTFIAAETRIGRGLSFWFLFCFLVLKRDFYYKEKSSSELCRNTGFYTILKKILRVFFWSRKSY